MITVNFMLFLVVILPVWAVYRVSVFLKNKKLNPQREILINIFFVYLLSVVYLTFFPLEIPLYDWRPSINIVPIKKTISMLRHGAFYTSFKNVAGNILLLYPIGIFLPMLFVKARSMKRVIMAGFLISISVEAAQLMTVMRICDIDDVILNTIGSLIGYLTYVIVKKASIRFSSLEGIVENKTRDSLFVLAVKPVIIILLFTMLPCLISFYDNTYSVFDGGGIDQSIYSKALKGNLDDGKVEKIIDSNGYKIVLAATKNADGDKEINVYVYRKVMFNRVIYMSQGNLQMNSQNAYSSLSFMPNKDTLLKIIYGKNSENLTATVEVTRGGKVYSKPLS